LRGFASVSAIWARGVGPSVTHGLSPIAAQTTPTAWHDESRAQEFARDYAVFQTPLSGKNARRYAVKERHFGRRFEPDAGREDRTATMNFAKMLLALVPILLLLPSAVQARSWFGAFKDPKDGQFDTSDFMINHHGPMFVPIIITEPALGYGGGGGLLFVHKNALPDQHQTLDDDSNPEQKPRFVPPNVTAVYGFGTETQSWAAGGQHLGIWRGDTIRTLTLGGYASLNLTFYPEDQAAEANLAGFVIEQEVEFRIGDTPLFLGARYRYSNVDVSPAESDGTLPDLPSDSLGALGIAAHWDTRDGIFAPTSGQEFIVGGLFNTPGFGGDTTFWELDYQLHTYHTVHPRGHSFLHHHGQRLVRTWRPQMLTLDLTG
jgi:hypothetical protein